ncbi:uncharacterized protein PGTG_11920 [Puccinia graminis f. sp. tritici CRL 75-36-700-3]|uniref:Uncharacterized protein n=1 Tax=Puccinia graminis f. sp. tritici (strain CRL 75-36-700-3 / race SCCL) TaxID=418459 RepID=E3KMN9_PUCGT|nr:uncharacterized protein PGTG_11920 [Puccinia graminis f. sp. tritici CRL 75-36-700-3]EFP85564.2 hypothetical protein PGTG_11920 [Puccinia graminis f. sp. tritici CRL 75-36-700-3]
MPNHEFSMIRQGHPSNKDSASLRAEEFFIHPARLLKKRSYDRALESAYDGRLALDEVQGSSRRMRTGMESNRQETVPHTDLALENSADSEESEGMMKLEFKALQRDLKEFKRATQRMSASIDPLWAKRGRVDMKKQLKQWIKDVAKLQQILKTIPTSPDRLFKLADKGVSLEPFETVENLEQRELLKSIRQIGKAFLTRIKSMPYRCDEVGFGKTSQRRSKVDVPTEEGESISAHTETVQLRGDVVDNIISFLTWGWLAELNTMLHEIIKIEPALEISRTHIGPIEALLFQRIIFRTVELLYEHELISQDQLIRFLAMKDTPRFASLQVDEGPNFLPRRPHWYQNIPISEFSDGFTNALSEAKLIARQVIS